MVELVCCLCVAILYNISFSLAMFLWLSQMSHFRLLASLSSETCWSCHQDSGPFPETRWQFKVNKKQIKFCFIWPTYLQT